MGESASQGRFVVLEHTWNGVHWDFMLEDGNVLRTWSIDEPITAGVELNARQLADHRLAYLTYEGMVSGQRGRVRRLAEGVFSCHEWTPDRVRVQLTGSQLVGVVDLYRCGSDPSAGSGSTWKFRIGKVD